MVEFEPERVKNKPDKMRPRWPLTTVKFNPSQLVYHVFLWVEKLKLQFDIFKLNVLLQWKEPYFFKTIFELFRTSRLWGKFTFQFRVLWISAFRNKFLKWEKWEFEKMQVIENPQWAISIISFFCPVIFVKEINTIIS
jgi:hypothetical protein